MAMAAVALRTLWTPRSGRWTEPSSSPWRTTSKVHDPAPGGDVDRLVVGIVGGAVGDGAAGRHRCRRRTGAVRVVGAQHLRPCDLAQVRGEARRRWRRRCRSARGDRRRRWSGSCRAAAARGGSGRSRRPRRRTGRRPVQPAPVPTSATSPPMTNPGASPASARISISIELVVVLPWVPATPIDRAWAQIDASMPARRSTGPPDACGPRRPRCCVGGIAVENVTVSTPWTTSRSWPDVQPAPGGPQPVEHGSSRRSLPDTSWPIWASTSAMALMPGPPTPTTW